MKTKWYVLLGVANLLAMVNGFNNEIYTGFMFLVHIFTFLFAAFVVLEEY